MRITFGKPSVRAWLSTSLLICGGAGLSCVHVPPPNEADVPNGPPIERVDVEGALNVPLSTLVAGLANRPPKRVAFSLDYGIAAKVYTRFDPLQVELDRLRIESFYAREGFFSALVKGPQQKNLRGNHIELRWTVNEGHPARIRRVVIDKPPPELVSTLQTPSLKEGAIYRSSDFEVARQNLRNQLFNAGYAHAEVEGRVYVDKATAEADVHFEIRSSDTPVYLGPIRALGNVRTPTSAIQARRPWKDGERYHPRLVKQLRARLYALDQYSGVRIEAPNKGPQPSVVIARVREVEQNEVRVGFGAGLDPANLYLRARARYKRRSFPFPLSNLTIELSPALQFLREGPNGGLEAPEFTPQARISLVHDDFPLSLFQLETSIGFRYQPLEAYEWFAPYVGQNLARPLLFDHLQLVLGWELLRYSYADIRIAGPGELPGISPQERLNIDRSQAVFVIRPSLSFDTRNDGLEPTRGYFARFGMDIGWATADNSSGFLSLSPEVRGYLPLGSERFVLASRAYLFTNLRGRLPAPRRVFAGGAASQRGFAQRQLSPTAELLNDDSATSSEISLIPIGGESVFELNVELRCRIARIFGYWFGLTFFADGADLGKKLRDIEFTRLHLASGVGVRYLTPIGAIRFDYGYRINRKQDASQPELNCRGALDCSAFHFSIGQAF